MGAPWPLAYAIFGIACIVLIVQSAYLSGQALRLACWIELEISGDHAQNWAAVGSARMSLIGNILAGGAFIAAAATMFIEGRPAEFQHRLLALLGLVLLLLTSWASVYEAALVVTYLRGIPQPGRKQGHWLERLPHRAVATQLLFFVLLATLFGYSVWELSASMHILNASLTLFLLCYIAAHCWGQWQAHKHVPQA